MYTGSCIIIITAALKCMYIETHSVLIGLLVFDVQLVVELDINEFT